MSRFLDETQKKAVEEILVACVKEANAKVDDELFGKGRSLPDSECRKLLTDRRQGSLQPDIVIHFTRNITRIQCIYDLKFPCGYDVGTNPWTPEVVAQMASYGRLGGECPPALITPQRAIVRQ